MTAKSHTNGNHPTSAATNVEGAPATAPTAKEIPTSARPVAAATLAGTRITAADVVEMLAQLDAMAAKFGDGAVPLTIDERRKLLKMRPGGETHATSVMKIGDRYGLAIPGVKSAQVEADTQLVQDLQELIARFNSMLGLATDVSAAAQSRIWRSATSTYATLVRLVPQYPNLQRDLTPMASFLAIRYKDAPTSLRTQEKGALSRSRSARKAKKAATSKGATTAATEPATTPAAGTTETAAAAQTPAPAAPATPQTETAPVAPEVAAAAKTPTAPN